MNVLRRVRLGLLLAAFLLICATAWRATNLVAAWGPGGAQTIALDVEQLGGGVLVEVQEDGVRARIGDRDLQLVPGVQVAVGEVILELRGGGTETSREILRRDWAVYAHPERGFRRIDVGPDPTGHGDGVRDRVVVPAIGAGTQGWFHLAPSGAGAEPRFLPEDRGAWVVAEQAGLTVQSGGLTHTLQSGGRALVRDRFAIWHQQVPLRLDVRWQPVRRASPVLDGAGRVQGYVDVDAVDLVVLAIEPGDRPTPGALLVRFAGTERSIPLPPRSRLLLHGRRDQLRPFSGGVLPTRAADRQLEAAVAAGLADGWIQVEAAGSRVAVPGDAHGPADGLSWALSRSVVELIDDYDRARSPVAFRLGPGLVAAAARCTDADDHTVGIRYAPSLQAWVPASRPLGGVHTCSIPASGSAETTWVETALPAAWHADDQDWTALAASRGVWRRHPVQVQRVIALRLDGRPAVAGPDRVAASVAGGPAGTTLIAASVRMSGRGFGDWDQRSAAANAAALAVWTRIPGDRWSVQGSAPAAVPDRPRPVFIRVPVTAMEAGWIALDVAAPGSIVSARWNDAALDPAALPEPGPEGARRLSLPVVPGENLLALHVERPPTAPVAEAGGARFLTDAAGTPTALAEHVAERRARRSVISEATPSSVVDRDAADAASVLVERGAAGIDAGTRWQIAPARERAATAELILAAGPGVVMRNDFGALVLTRQGLEWHNGDRLTLGGIRRVDTDPEGPPVAGFKIRPGTRWDLTADGQAIAGPDFRLAAAPQCGGEELSSPIIVVFAGTTRCVDVQGRPRWAEDPGSAAVPATRLRVRTDGFEGLSVGCTRPASLWTPDAEVTPVPASPQADRLVAWPAGAWLVIPGSDLRLRRPWPADEATLRAPSPVASGRVTIDDDLQAHALSALDAHQAFDAAASTEPDTHGLLGAVLLLDARDGDVLACAARDRAGRQSPTACWTDHDLRPGSTFKIATAAAALGSDDPVVRAMLDGRLPSGLTRTGASGSLNEARLPRLPLGSGPDRPLRTRLSNFRNQPMASDLDLEGALRGSVNTWFGYLGPLLHNPLRQGWGDAAIASRADRGRSWAVLDVASAAGFGERMDLGLGVWGTGGSVPHEAADSDAQVAARAIGQDAVRATPLGIAGLVSMVATDGRIPRPRLDPDRAPARTRVLSEADAARLRAALADVVVRGTASRAFADHPFRSLMIGKTGSAQRIDANGLPRTDSWFAGAVMPPPDLDGAPVVVVVVLPGAGLGGRHAAEVADDVSRAVIVARGWDRSEVIAARW